MIVNFYIKKSFPIYMSTMVHVISITWCIDDQTRRFLFPFTRQTPHTAEGKAADAGIREMR